jgi:hypothetical protein
MGNSAGTTASVNNQYVLKTDLAKYAQKSDLSKYVPSGSSDYVTKSDLDGYAQKSDLSTYAPLSALGSYTLASDLTGNYVTKDSMSNYVQNNTADTMFNYISQALTASSPGGVSVNSKSDVSSITIPNSTKVALTSYWDPNSAAVVPAYDTNGKSINVCSFSNGYILLNVPGIYQINYTIAYNDTNTVNGQSVRSSWISFNDDQNNITNGYYESNGNKGGNTVMYGSCMYNNTSATPVKVSVMTWQNSGATIPMMSKNFMFTAYRI